MKRILFILTLLAAISTASADWNTTGYGGMDWTGNTSMTNVAQNGNDDNNVGIGLAADYYNRANNDDLGSSWHEQTNWAEINDSMFKMRLGTPATYNIFQNVSLTAKNYSIGFTFVDVDTVTTNQRVFVSTYQTSYTADSVGPRVSFQEGFSSMLASWSNGTYIGSKDLGIVLENARVRMDWNGNNVSIFINDTYKGYLDEWGDAAMNGTVSFSCDNYGDGVYLDNFRVWDTTSGNLTRNTFDSGSGNKTSKVRIHGNNPVAGANITVAINKSTDQSSWVWEELGTVTTVGDFNVTYDVTGSYRYAKWDFYAQTNTSAQTPLIYNGSLYYEAAGAAAGAPSITSYAPTGSIYPEVADSQLFNVTVNQSTYCTWYVNGSQVQYNSSLSTTHAYTNTSLLGGGCNVTAVVNNSNGADSHSWIFEVGADSISYIIMQDTPTNQSMIFKVNVKRIGSNVTDWGWWQNHTFDGWNYVFRFTNGTEIMNLTASGNNDTLWFNHTSLLPTGVYFINATTTYNAITLYANEYAMINNWTTTQNFSQVDANISNVVCGSWYNYTSGLWEAYRSGRSYNSNADIPKNCSVFVFVDGQTTVSATVNSGGVTIQNASWFYGYLPGSTAKTLTEIETAMDADGLDVWSLYGFSNVTQAYTSTGSYSIAPNEGYAVYCNTTGEFTP